jgi:branched-chain amino acid transport system permease protein
VQLLLFPLPSGLFIQGLLIGGLTALVALGMALTYRSNRIINFAQADLGFAPVVLVFMLMTAWGWPYLLAVAAGIVGALVLGAAVELIFIRRFFRAPRLLLTVATLGIAQVLAATAILLPRLWHGQRLLAVRIEPPFSWRGEIGGVVFNANHLVAAIAIPLVIGGVALFLRGSAVGVAIRASADSADRAWLLGVPVKRLQTVVWSVAGLLAFGALFLRAGILGIPPFSALSFAVLLRALTALVLGRMTNLLSITTSALALGVLETGVDYNQAKEFPLIGHLPLDPLLGVVILITLLGGRSSSSRSSLGDASTWQSAEDVRPVARELGRLPTVRLARWAAMAAVLAAGLALPAILSIDQTYKATAVLVYAVLGLSVVVLTGWGGQVSLGQVGFFALGAAVGAKATDAWGLDLTLALLLAMVVGGLASIVVGFPALRLRGFYLAVTTLAFALAATTYFLNSDYFSWVPEPGARFARPPLFGRFDIDSTTRMYYLSLVVLLLCLGALAGVRRSRTGRVLLALRDNEKGAQAYAVHAIRVRLVAFVLSGALAALAGAVFVHFVQGIDRVSYEPDQNFVVLTMVIVGGVTTPLGAVLGAIYLQGIRWFLPTEWQFLASGLGVLLVLLILPSGLGSLFFRLRDHWLQWVADRHGIDAPGLTRETPAEIAEEEPDVLVGSAS